GAVAALKDKGIAHTVCSLLIESGRLFPAQENAQMAVFLKGFQRPFRHDVQGVLNLSELRRVDERLNGPIPSKAEIPTYLHAHASAFAA
ncbi:MAG: hypothetical protein AB7E32_05965, partial [Desulfovibrio sp.]